MNADPSFEYVRLLTNPVSCPKKNSFGDQIFNPPSPATPRLSLGLSKGDEPVLPGIRTLPLATSRATLELMIQSTRRRWGPIRCSPWGPHTRSRCLACIRTGRRVPAQARDSTLSPGASGLGCCSQALSISLRCTGRGRSRLWTACVWESPRGR